MLDTIKIFFITLIVFLIIDIVWITLVAKGMYDTHIGSLLGDVKLAPSLLFYLIYISGILFFVIYPSIDKQSFSYALLAGAFLGLIGYGTFALTNLATLKDWALIISVGDILWGAFLTAATSGIVYQLIKVFGW